MNEMKKTLAEALLNPNILLSIYEVDFDKNDVQIKNLCINEGVKLVAELQTNIPWKNRSMQVTRTKVFSEWPQAGKRLTESVVEAMQKLGFQGLGDLVHQKVDVRPIKYDDGLLSLEDSSKDELIECLLEIAKKEHLLFCKEDIGSGKNLDDILQREETLADDKAAGDGKNCSEQSDTSIQKENTGLAEWLDPFFSDEEKKRLTKAQKKSLSEDLRPLVGAMVKVKLAEVFDETVSEVSLKDNAPGAEPS